MTDNTPPAKVPDETQEEPHEEVLEVVSITTPSPKPLAKKFLSKNRRLLNELNQLNEFSSFAAKAPTTTDALTSALSSIKSPTPSTKKYTPTLTQSRGPVDILRDLEQEANILKALRAKLEDQLHLLQVEELVIKKQLETVSCMESATPARPTTNLTMPIPGIGTEPMDLTTDVEETTATTTHLVGETQTHQELVPEFDMHDNNNGAG